MDKLHGQIQPQSKQINKNLYPTGSAYIGIIRIFTTIDFQNLCISLPPTVSYKLDHANNNSVTKTKLIAINGTKPEQEAEGFYHLVVLIVLIFLVNYLPFTPDSILPCISLKQMCQKCVFYMSQK